MKIHGSVCALVTPFTSDGALDMAAFGRLLDFQIAGGTQAVVVAGSTGEAHMLEQDEYDRLLTFAVKHVAGRIPVMAGTGEAGTAKTVAATQHARKLGADAALVVTPYYVRPTQEGLRRHFLEVADRGGLPVILYNVPGRTGCDLAPETTATLRDHPAIVAIKEARGDAERIQRTAELVRPDFVYLSGDDASGAQAMLAGAAGVISVVANLVPKAFRALCDAATAGDREAAARCHTALDPLVQALNCAPNPIAVKAGLPDLGLGTAQPRLPLVELEQGPAREQLRKALSTLASLADAA
ncbi:MAG TPA: 4-hydroxy-tetrahydrodipicolinate synthase [Dyella sp.]|nr:4-hydroxy-tetrahydrodipicolinate synthase [Dyella sp.]